MFCQLGVFRFLLVLLRTEGDVVLEDMCAYVCTLSCKCVVVV